MHGPAGLVGGPQQADSEPGERKARARMLGCSRNDVSVTRATHRAPQIRRIPEFPPPHKQGTCPCERRDGKSAERSCAGPALVGSLRGALVPMTLALALRPPPPRPDRQRTHVVIVGSSGRREMPTSAVQAYVSADLVLIKPLPWTKAIGLRSLTFHQTRFKQAASVGNGHQRTRCCCLQEQEQEGEGEEAQRSPSSRDLHGLGQAPGGGPCCCAGGTTTSLARRTGWPSCGTPPLREAWPRRWPRPRRRGRNKVRAEGSSGVGGHQGWKGW